MYMYQLGDISDKQATLKALGVEGGGVRIMSKKMELFYFLIKGLKTPAANILKQDALSIGAELAVPGGVILCEESTYDCILVANRKQIEILSQKELSQPFGLKYVASELQKFLSIRSYPIRIMGVLNANDDSFFVESRFSSESFMTRCHEMIARGADIIDIGAVSSRPGAAQVSESIELERIRPICDMIQSEKLYEKIIFSIDSYTPSVIEYALKSGFSIINDITGASDEEIIALAIEHKAKLCIMHMQGTPQIMQANPQYEDVIVEVSRFFEERISRCETMGLERDNIMLDVGIGFGKRLEHNIALVKNMAHFAIFGCELLVGASRKSMIDDIVPTKIEDRVSGSLAVHLKAVANGASIIRCHDVAEHKQAITVFKALG